MKTLLALLIVAALPSSAATKPLHARVEAYVKPYVARNAFSGVVLVAKGDEVLFEKAYGMANAEFAVPNRLDTRFAIASITKRFTAIILRRLEGEKKLSMDDKLARWVPDFPAADEITIGQLATHRSGVRDPKKLRGTIRSNLTSAETVDLLKVEPLGSKPGETYSYTTANYAILGHIIERVTGQSYATVVSRYVYEPARMKDSGELLTTLVVPRLATGYMPDPATGALSVSGPEDTSWKIAGGSSYSTARDLHRFVRKFRDEPWDTGTMLDKKVFSSSGAFPGAGANLLYFPDDELTVVVLTNNYATVSAKIAGDLAAMAFGKDIALPDVKLVSLPPDERIAGSYAVTGRTWVFTIAFRDGNPVASWTPARRTALLRVSEDTYFMPLDWALLALHFDEQGRYTGGTFTLPDTEPMEVTRTK
jgi:CubicO group peptidase (beta-lactamase class C family)